MSAPRYFSSSMAHLAIPVAVLPSFAKSVISLRGLAIDRPLLIGALKPILTSSSRSHTRFRREFNWYRNMDRGWEMNSFLQLHGGGLIVIFNGPVSCADPCRRAVRLAADMRDAVASLARSWSSRGHELGFGVGVAQVYATPGPVGFEGRFDYTAIGTVINVAARLCAEARQAKF
jgi:class 3 adenylate cyclase